MKIKWLAHASFLITADNGTRIITDPYTTSEKLHYGEIQEAADIVTVSHDHFDHSNAAAVRGNPQVVKNSSQAKGIQFNGIATYHDDAAGEKRGKNTIFCFEVDEIIICHLGDLGHPLNEKQAAGIGSVDILLTPVGGFYTIDAAAATEVCRQLKPRVIIPMHFKTERCDFPISGVEDFLRGKKNVTRPDASEVTFHAGNLPAEAQITMLKPTL